MQLYLSLSQAELWEMNSEIPTWEAVILLSGLNTMQSFKMLALDIYSQSYLSWFLSIDMSKIWQFKIFQIENRHILFGLRMLRLSPYKILTGVLWYLSYCPRNPYMLIQQSVGNDSWSRWRLYMESGGEGSNPLDFCWYSGVHLLDN